MLIRKIFAVLVFAGALYSAGLAYLDSKQVFEEAARLLEDHHTARTQCQTARLKSRMSGRFSKHMKHDFNAVTTSAGAWAASLVLLGLSLWCAWAIRAPTETRNVFDQIHQWDWTTFWNGYAWETLPAFLQMQGIDVVLVQADEYESQFECHSGGATVRLAVYRLDAPGREMHPFAARFGFRIGIFLKAKFPGWRIWRMISAVWLRSRIQSLISEHQRIEDERNRATCQVTAST